MRQLLKPRSRPTRVSLTHLVSLDGFPRLFQFEFEAISLNRIKRKAGHTVQISPDERAVIIPFAQSEQVDTLRGR